MYCQISEFIWLYQENIEHVRAWIGHHQDPYKRDWRSLCFDPNCIDKARAILQPGVTNPVLVLPIQLPSTVRADIVNKHIKPPGFNFNDPSFLQRSSTTSLQPTVSMTSFTLCTVHPCHPVIRPSCTIMSMIQHAHNLPTSPPCIKSNCSINLPPLKSVNRRKKYVEINHSVIYIFM